MVLEVGERSMSQEGNLEAVEKLFCETVLYCRKAESLSKKEPETLPLALAIQRPLTTFRWVALGECYRESLIAAGSSENGREGSGESR